MSWGKRSVLDRGDAHESDVGEAVGDLERRDRHVLDAEAGVGVDEGFGGLGELGAALRGRTGSGGRDGLDVVLDGVAEDGHVGAAGPHGTRRGEGAAAARARGGGRGLEDGLGAILVQREEEVEVVAGGRHGICVRDGERERERDAI